jgi:hypothetical protein
VEDLQGSSLTGGTGLRQRAQGYRQQVGARRRILRRRRLSGVGHDRALAQRGTCSRGRREGPPTTASACAWPTRRRQRGPAACLHNYRCRLPVPSRLAQACTGLALPARTFSAPSRSTTGWAKINFSLSTASAERQRICSLTMAAFTTPKPSSGRLRVRDRRASRLPRFQRRGARRSWGAPQAQLRSPRHARADRIRHQTGS